MLLCKTKLFTRVFILYIRIKIIIIISGNYNTSSEYELLSKNTVISFNPNGFRRNTFVSGNILVGIQ